MSTSVILTLFCICQPSVAEEGFLLLLVTDVHHTNQTNLSITVAGGGTTRVGSNGVGKIRLPPATQEGQVVDISVSSPGGWVFIDPWEGRLEVPSFASNIPKVVVVAKQADHDVLTDDKAMKSIAKKVTQPGPDRLFKANSPEERRHQVLEEVAYEFKLDPEDVDRALRAWFKNAKDQYYVGLGELYERKYPEATPHLRQAVIERKKAMELDTAKMEQDTAKVVEADISLAFAQTGSGDYAGALASLQEANHLRPNDYEISASMAAVLFEAADFEGSQKQLQIASGIEQKENVPNPDHLLQIALMSAMILDARNLKPESISVYQRAASIAESNKLDRETRDMAFMALAYSYLDVGKQDKAESVARKALMYSDGPDGRQDDVVARDLSTLSLILTLQHKSKEAADFRVRAIETLKVLSDKGGSTQALYTRQLADAFGDQRKDTEALTLYKKALQLDEDRFGDQSPELVADLNSLASCSDTLHDYESAVRYSRRALKLVANSVGTGHPDYADQLEDLAKLLRRTKNFTEGEERYQAAIEIDKAAYGPKHPDVADLFRNLGLLLRDAKKFKEAEASHRSALEIYEHANPLNEREVALTLDYLALVVRDQGRLDEAISLFSRASAICEKSLDPADRLVERVKLNIEKTRAMQTNPNQH